MIKNKILHQYFLLASAVIILFIFLGFSISRFVAESFRPDRQQMPTPLPPIFIAKTIDHLNYPNKIEALKALDSWHGDDQFRPHFVLLNSDYEVVYTKSEVSHDQLPPHEILKNLVKDYDYAFYGEEDRPPMSGGPPPGGGPGLGPMPLGPGGPPPSGGPIGFRKVVIRLNGPVPFYVVMIPPHAIRPFLQQPGGGMMRWIPLLGIGSLVFSLLIGVGVTLLLIYLSVRKKVSDADHVISELQKGNLKARFQIDRNDEFGQAMLRFNQMADEIEQLVTHLKDVEITRTKLLQELAHDLRTPIASLKTLLETLETNNDRLDAKTKSELLSLSNKEIDYFARLVEDLLVLSQVAEVKYHQQTSVDISQILQEEIDDISLRYKAINPHLQIQEFISSEPLLIAGDHILIRRMLRNALENSASFAKTQLIVTLEKKKNIEIILLDNGPGFKAEVLDHFGERRYSRQTITQDKKTSRLSVGLGSVIMKKICEIHGGKVSASNRINEAGIILGAEVRFTF